MVRYCLQVIMLWALTGCMADDVLSGADSQSSGTPMAFAAEVSAPAAPSRGVVTNADNLDEFAVSASITDADATSVYFSHETYPLGRVGGQVQTSLSGQTHYWLDSDSHYDFFAYSPCPDISFASGVIDKFDFTVNADVVSQADIVVCAALDAAYGQSVQLRFKHPLSRISLSQGTQMAEGTIKSITFSGIMGQGTYDMRKSEWTTVGADTTTFTLDCSEAAAPGASITGNLYNFFFIPQTLGPDARLQVNFVDSLGVAHIYAKQLSGQWAAGDSYNYTLSISPQLTFTVADTIIDAYYSIVKVKVDAPNIMPDVEWAVSVAASDNADVSVQWQENANSLAKLGFWTDNYLVNGVATGSARGSSSTETISGSGADYLYVFVPENVGTSDRTITISAKTVDSVLAQTQITQKCPAVGEEVLWSQLDDDSLCDFGFSWTRSVAYVLPYSVSEYGLETDFSESDALSMLNGMISLADASTYAHIATYYQYHIDNVGTIWHYYLHLNYALCNMLPSGSALDGYTNTVYLNEHGGTAATEAFKLMITKATQASAAGQNLFRLPSAAYAQEDDVPRPSGIDNMSLSALCRVLKRNRYNYAVRQVGEAMLEYPSLAAADLVWYLPAVGQFHHLPAEVVDPIVPSQCWSSTSIHGRTSTYLGNGTAASRALLAHVRCCRKQP